MQIGKQSRAKTVSRSIAQTHALVFEVHQKLALAAVRELSTRETGLHDLTSALLPASILAVPS
jgi:hypothetical protein